MKLETYHNTAPETVSWDAHRLVRQCVTVISTRVGGVGGGVCVIVCVRGPVRHTLSADGEVDNVEDDAEAASDDEQ